MRKMSLLKKLLREQEKEILAQYALKCSSVSAMARELGISRSGLWRKLKNYGFKIERKVTITSQLRVVQG